MFYILSLFLSFLILLYPSIIEALPIGIHKMIAYEASLIRNVPSEIRVRFKRDFAIDDFYLLYHRRFNKGPILLLQRLIRYHRFLRVPWV